MVNPYEPTGHSSPPVESHPIRQRWIAFAFVGFGLISWASLFYAFKDFRIYTEPGYQQVVHYVGFWFCGLFGWLAAITGILGIGASIHRRWHPWKTSLAYLIAGVPLCYAGGVVTFAFATGVEM